MLLYFLQEAILKKRIVLICTYVNQHRVKMSVNNRDPEKKLRERRGHIHIDYDKSSGGKFCFEYCAVLAFSSKTIVNKSLQRTRDVDAGFSEVKAKDWDAHCWETLDDTFYLPVLTSLSHEGKQ